MQTLTFRAPWAALGGALLSLVDVTMPFALICTAMVVADCASAWALSRRVRRVHPRASSAGKLSSRRLGRVVVTLGRIYALLLLAAAVDCWIVADGTHAVMRFCAGAVVVWQTLSILENEASCSDARWAVHARRYLVDKVKRHLDS